MIVHLPPTLPKGLNRSLLIKVFEPISGNLYKIEELERLSEARQSKVYKLIGDLDGQSTSFIIKIGSKEQIEAISEKEKLLYRITKRLITIQNIASNRTEAIALYVDASDHLLISMDPLKKLLADPGALQNAVRSVIDLIKRIHLSARKTDNNVEFLLGTAFLLSQLKTDLVLSEVEFIDAVDDDFQYPNVYQLSEIANRPYLYRAQRVVYLDVFNCSLADTNDREMKYICEDGLFLTITAKFKNTLHSAKLKGPPIRIKGKIVNTRTEFYLEKLLKEGFTIKENKFPSFITYQNVSYPNPFIQISKFFPHNLKREEWREESLTISDNGIVHGDCNVSNFLLNRTGLAAALIDFERASVSHEEAGFEVTERCAPIAWDYLVLFQSIKISVLGNLLRGLRKWKNLIHLLHEFEWILWVYIIFPETNEKSLIDHFKNSVNDEGRLSDYLHPLFTILDSLISRLKEANKNNIQYDYTREVSKIYYFTCLRFAKHIEVFGVKFISCVIGASFSSEINSVNILKHFTHEENVPFVLNLILNRYKELSSLDKTSVSWKGFGELLTYWRKKYLSSLKLSDQSLKNLRDKRRIYKEILRSLDFLENVISEND